MLERETCQPFYVNISGNDTPLPGETCTWTVGVSIPLESTPPYTYEWQWNGYVVGNGNTYTRNTSGDEGWNLLEVTAWDFYGSEAAGGMEVIVDELMGWPCS